MRYPNWAPRLSSLASGLITIAVPGLLYLFGLWQQLDETARIAVLTFVGVVVVLLRDGISRRYNVSMNATLRPTGNLRGQRIRADGTRERERVLDERVRWLQTVWLVLLIVGLSIIAMFLPRS